MEKEEDIYYGCPIQEIPSLGIFSNDIVVNRKKDWEGNTYPEPLREYPKQVEYNKCVARKLIFYKENNIPIKFRLIEPKNYYETKGKILELGVDKVIIEQEDIKIVNFFWEIDIHTIYPINYNPLIEFNRHFISDEIRNAIYKRDNYQCMLKLDGCTNKPETIDHLIPISFGGQDNPENLQTSCLHCNCKKGNKVLI